MVNSGAVDIQIIISVVTVILSIVSSLIIVSFQAGKYQTKLTYLEQTIATLLSTMVTKEELAGLKENLAEIRGMFRFTLKDSQ